MSEEGIQASDDRFHSRTAGISEPSEERKYHRIKSGWASDITYFQLQHEYIYLAVILDLASRKCIVWDLGRNFGSQLPVNSLTKALKIAEQNPQPVSFIIRIRVCIMHPKIM